MIGSTVVHMFLVILFVKVLDYGFLGICWATSLMFLSRFIIVTVQIEMTAGLNNIYGLLLFSKESTENVHS
jgi:uncharacterized protein (DUF697 family)